MPENIRYYRCDRCGELYPIISEDRFDADTKRNGPHPVRFEYKSRDRYIKVKTYAGEWCDQCTTAYLEPLTQPEAKSSKEN